MVKVQVSTEELVAGRYRLFEVVHREAGRPGWHGQDVEFGQPVAVTRSRLPDDGQEETAHRVAARIRRESELLAAVCPGRVAAVVDVIHDNGVLWTVAERPEGTPLVELLRHGPMEPVRAARLGLALLDVLEAAHREGVTHGDLSPGQVYVQERGGVVVSGFGLLGATPSPRTTAPSYASPEQARGEDSGPAADLWTLGALLYAMVEGRPLFRDRGRLSATLRAVDRLPLRPPLNAGPLGPAIQGLLRRDPLERVPEPIVRAALTRILRDDANAETGSDAVGSAPTTALPLVMDSYSAPGRTGRRGRAVSRPVVVGVALVFTGACFAAVTAAGGLLDRSSSASDPTVSPSSPASGSPAPAPTSTSTGQSAAPAPASPTPRSPTPSPTPTSPAPEKSAGKGLPSGFHRYVAPQGFSIGLPDGWKPLQTRTSDGLSYRVTFGAAGDPRTLAVTYSEQLGPDPVAIWQALEPSLRSESTGYERIGDIRAVTYQGHKAADMEWLFESDGVQERTFGRGFLLGDHRGYSLRWTTPADDWNTAGNQQALDVFLESFQGT
ncbi:serine/threonine-protein kinase [Streptomyces sp. NPDC005485]|uniref:serine/threonine-protein kinase n=1 Tax=Streptomyces sp. NPDC005485 TaxID=3155591 RepID=UPI0033B6203F